MGTVHVRAGSVSGDGACEDGSVSDDGACEGGNFE